MNRLCLMVAGAVLVVLGGCGGAGSARTDAGPQGPAKPVPSGPCAAVGIDAFAEVIPNPEENLPASHSAPAAPTRPQDDIQNSAVCRIDAGAGVARGSQLIMLVIRYGDGAGRSGTDWAKVLMADDCTRIKTDLSPTGGDMAAELLAGLGDQSRGVQDPGSSQISVEYHLRVRRGRDEVRLDVIRVAGDADTPRHLATLAKTIFGKLL